MAESDFTRAICEVLYDRAVMQRYSGGIAPVEILEEVWRKYPNEFQLCTVIDVCHEMDAIHG